MNLGIPKKNPTWKLRDFDGLEEGKKVLEKLGLPEPAKPKVLDLKYPEDNLPDLSYKDLSTFLGRVGSVAGYAEWLLGCATAEREVWETKYIHSSGLRSLKHEREGNVEKNKDLRDAAVDAEPDIAYRLKRYLRALSLEHYLRGLLKAYDQMYSKVSRELSMREARYRRQRRD